MNYFSVENLAFHTFSDINLSLSKAECIGLSGPSGVGKSLFLRALADLDPHEGKISLDGILSDAMPAHLWRRQVALLPAEAAWWHTTVGEHFNGIDFQWLSQLGFDETVLKWQISRLSSGERQRLALLRVLCNHPKLLLLDEPTANLDSENSRKVENLVASIRIETKMAVIWVSHDIEQLKRISTYYLVLNMEGLKEIPSQT